MAAQPPYRLFNTPYGQALDTFGAPLHGFYYNGKLYDADTGVLKKDWVGEVQGSKPGGTGDIRLLKVPGLAEVSRTPQQAADDAANGYSWQNYALLTSGSHLHGVPGLDIGFYGYIYIDDAGTPWLINIRMAYPIPPVVSPDDPEIRIETRIVRPFGIITHDGRYDHLQGTSWEDWDTLGTYVDPATDVPWSDYNPGGVSAGGLGVGTVVEHNSRGSDFMINIVGSRATGTIGSYHGHYGVMGSTAIASKLLTVVRMTVSGTGSLDVATLGSGISVSFSKYRDYSQCFTETETETGTHHIVESTPSMLRAVSGIDQIQVVNCGGLPFCTELPPVPENYTGEWLQYVRDEYVVFNAAEEVDTPKYQYDYDLLLQVGFDIDTPVEYKAQLTYQGWRTDSQSITTTSKHSHHTEDWGVYVDGEYQGPGTEVNDNLLTGEVITRTIINEAYQTATLFLLRNSTIIDSLTTYDTQQATQSESIRDDGTDYTDHGTTASSSVVVDGVNPTDPQVSYVLPIVHRYSQQVMGLQARDTDPLDPRFVVLGKVVTPYGSNSEGDGVAIHGTGALAALSAGGSFHPIKQVARYYDPIGGFFYRYDGPTYI